ncbi:MAG: aminotransferase class III-fold pyridoxal phosphate-dependent enzyme, partial [Desulfobulbia bacterium]
SGTVPMGGVIASKRIYQSMMDGPEHAPELFHGYTYSAHPIAVAAGLATLELYKQDGLFERAKSLEPVFADALHSLKDHPNVVDIRTLGLAGAIELSPNSEGAGKRGFEAMNHGFYEQDIMVRITGDTIAMSPPLIISEGQIAELADKVGAILKALN